LCLSVEISLLARLIHADRTSFHRTLLMTLYATGARNAEVTLSLAKMLSGANAFEITEAALARQSDVTMLYWFENDWMDFSRSTGEARGRRIIDANTNQLSLRCELPFANSWCTTVFETVADPRAAFDFEWKRSIT
jgi:hypothetical protein